MTILYFLFYTEYRGTKFISYNARFISPDDVQYLGATGDLFSFNMYTYCADNPVMRADYTGNFGITIGVLLIGGLIGSALNVGISYGLAKFNLQEYTWKNAVVDGVTGFISGAFAVTPLNLYWQIGVCVALGFGSSVLLDVLEDEKIDIERAINSATISGAASYLAGSGIGLTNSVQQHGWKGIEKVVVKEGVKSFSRSVFLNGLGMYFYDYANSEM